MFSVRVAALAVGASLIAGKAVANQVIPDDLIVQGSACVGLDCVNNESFGFDTIRLKENNTRIKFEDTSVGQLPDQRLAAHRQRLRERRRQQVLDRGHHRLQGAVHRSPPARRPTRSSSTRTGRVGLRTSTPVLDLHVNTSNTPAIRLEQNNSGGFTAQTWDIAGNEANFFVRDVTGGSRLPFRIRPGAPTSSIDISASGNVGIGTASPNEGVNRVAKWRFANETNGSITTDNVLVLSNGGNIGVGIASPAARLHTTGSVRFAGVNSCGAGIVSAADGTLSCLASSAQFKHVAGALSRARR